MEVSENEVLNIEVGWVNWEDQENSRLVGRGGQQEQNQGKEELGDAVDGPISDSGVEEGGGIHIYWDILE